MKIQKILAALTAVFILGVIVSAQLVYDHYQIANGAHYQSLCNLGGIYNCEAVNGSKYSVLFGIPLAAWGLSFYIFAFLFSTLALIWKELRRDTLTVFFPLTIFSVILSIVLFYISFLKINSLCIFCMSLYAINITALLLVVYLLHLDNASGEKRSGFITTWVSRLLSSDKNKLTWILGTGFILTATVVAATQSLKEDELPLDLDNFMYRYNNAQTQHIPTDGSPLLGNEQSKLQIIEFSDFECPFCARQSREVKKILLNYGNHVSFVFKNFPLDMNCNSMMKRPMHKNACLAAQAGFCANKQGKFNSFHEDLFHNQKTLDEAHLLLIAKNHELDIDSFKSCIYGDEAKSAIKTDIALGQDLGIQGTPTFFINGKRIEGLVTKEAIGRILQEAN